MKKRVQEVVLILLLLGVVTTTAIVIINWKVPSNGYIASEYPYGEWQP